MHREGSTSSNTKTSDPRRGFTGAAEDGDQVCASCSFDIPDKLSQRLPEGAPGSPSGTEQSKHGSPVLRTRGSIIAACESSSESLEKSDDDELGMSLPQPSLGNVTGSELMLPASSILAFGKQQSSNARKPSTSSTSSSGLRHIHKLTYITTRHPTEPSHYTALRHSCIRTLSLENLPRGMPSGPLLFGDASSGHTIAFIFRLSDPYARGRRRTYALLAMNPGQDAARVGQAMGRVISLFRQIANWIIGLAERANEKSSNEFEVNVSDPVQESAPSEPNTPGLTQVSSFLSAKRSDVPRRRIYGNLEPMDPNRKFATRGRGGDASGVGAAKGLAELVGREGLFVELHVAFVKALMTLSRELGGV